MSESTRQLLGIISIVIGLAGYAQYLFSIYQGKTRPHVFTWFIWGFLTAIVYYGQLREGAGAGSWVTGLTAFMCIFISIISAKSGNRDLKFFDWICLYAALTSIVLWQLVQIPEYSMILISFINAVAFLPTFRKCWQDPYRESLISFALATLKFIPGIFALSVFSLSTILYPLSIVIMNSFFIGMLIYLRRDSKHVIQSVSKRQ